jgi:hypothetical protein
MGTDNPIYLDYNATTPVLPEVLEAMLPYSREHAGNPSSSHVFGRRARAAVDGARQVPQWFWSGVPLGDLEAWVRAQVPAEMTPNIERGMQTARFKLAEKQTFLPAAAKST